MTQTYDVHLFPLVRMKIPGVQAESQIEAIEKAIEGFAFNSPFVFGDAEYADELEFFVVDEAGDEEYERSQWYEYDIDGQLVAGMNGKWTRPTAKAAIAKAHGQEEVVMTFGNRDLIAASPEYARARTRYSNEVDPVIRALEPATEEEYGYPWRYRPGYWTEMRPIDKTREDIYREFAQSLAAKSLKHGYVMDGPPGDGSAPREVIVPLDAKLAFQEEL